MSTPQLTTDDGRLATVHGARLHALAAALCALLLLVALGVMDAQHAPWWALLATQGALLVTTASAGIWLDRALAFGVRRSAFGREGQKNGRRGGTLTVAGTAHSPSTEQVFWQERGQRENREDKN